MRFVYFIQAMRLGLVKIGQARDPIGRLCELQVGSPDQLSLLGSIRCADTAEAVNLERSLHSQFAADRSHGEWFSPTADLMELIAQRVGDMGEDERLRVYLRALAVVHSPDTRRRVRYAERRRRELLRA